LINTFNFLYRKWLPNIRKLSQGRGDKALADASKLASAAGTGVNRDPKQNFKVSFAF
jgi:hypothetical protein